MKNNYHFIGIGGIGMSGLARILLSYKKNVSGSDLAASYVTDELVKSGAKVFIGHSAANISPEMIVVCSSDIKIDNPEYVRARELKCPILHRSEMLQELTLGSKALAVTGTHGKTTTSSLLTSVLINGKMDPTYVVGGILSEWKTNAGYGKGDYFVVEADESDGTFLNYRPYGAIVTNIDLDHMNHFKTEEFLLQSFKEFAANVSSSQHLFWCGEDTRLASLNLPGISYGFTEECALRGSHFQQNDWSISFDVEFKGRRYEQVEVSTIGYYNALNGLAVFGLALSLGLSEEAVRAGLRTFKGVGRRCEKKGEVDDILFLDDYAHHPTEIDVTLGGIRRSIGNRRLVCVFQPHRYSRVSDCLGTYGGIFDKVDELFITDIYGAGEAVIPGLTYLNIAEEISQNRAQSMTYVPRQQLGSVLSQVIKVDDVVVTLGAGDVTKVCGEVIALYSKSLCYDF